VTVVVPATQRTGAIIAALCVAEVFGMAGFSSFAALLLGLALIGVGTFFAQATATGFVGRAATTDRGSASGLYLASYFLGGLAGSAVLGQIFDRLGWTACVLGIGVSLALGALLATRLIAPVHRPDATTAFQLASAPSQGEATN